MQYPSIGPAAVTQVIAPATIVNPFAWATVATLNITLGAQRALMIWSYLTWSLFQDAENNPMTRITVDGVEVTRTIGRTGGEQNTQSAHALVSAIAAGAHTITLDYSNEIDTPDAGYPIFAGELTALVCQ